MIRLISQLYLQNQHDYTHYRDEETVSLNFAQTCPYIQLVGYEVEWPRWKGILQQLIKSNTGSPYEQTIIPQRNSYKSVLRMNIIAFLYKSPNKEITQLFINERMNR